MSFNSLMGNAALSAGGQQQDPFAQYLQAMGGMGPGLPMQLASAFGGPLLGAIGSLFQGESWGDKNAKKVSSMAENRLGQNVLDPQQYMSQYMRAMAPQLNQQGERIGQRLGLDSGVAQGEMAFQQQAPMAQFLLETGRLNDQLKAQRDTSLLSLMGSLSGGR